MHFVIRMYENDHPVYIEGRKQNERFYETLGLQEPYDKKVNSGYLLRTLHSDKCNPSTR